MERLPSDFSLMVEILCVGARYSSDMSELLEPEQFRVSKVPLSRDTHGRIDLRASFGDFVRTLDDDWERISGEFVYYTPQAEILGAKAIEFTHVVKAEESGALDTIFAEHDVRLSLPIPRINRGPSFDPYALYDESSAQLARDRYAADLARYGYDAEPTIHEDGPDPLDAMAERLLREVHDRSERLGLLYRSLGTQREPIYNA